MKALVLFIAIPVLTWFATDKSFRSAHEERIQQENMLIANKLKIEIAYRAMWVEGYLDNLEVDIESGGASGHSVLMSRLIMPIDQANNGLHINLFNEYGSQSMASLLSSLALILEPSDSMQRIIVDAMLSTKELQGMSTDIHSNNPKTAITELIEGTKKQLKNLSKVTREYYPAKHQTKAIPRREFLMWRSIVCQW